MSFHFARGSAKLLLVAALLLQFTLAVQAQAAPTFAIVEPEIALGPGKLAGHGVLLLTGTNLGSENIGKPIEDLGGLDTGLTGRIKLDVRDLDRTETMRRWLLTAEIEGLPNNVVQKRYLTFRFDGKTMTLPFTLTNKNPATFVWSVKGPSEISLPPGEPIEISVAVQDVGATRIGLLQSSLLEQSRKRPVDGGWILCKKRATDPSACQSEDINLAPHSTQQLLLYPAKGSTLVGKYMGNVTIGASEKPEGETLAMTVYGTPIEYRIAGVATIFIGVVLAWVLTVYLQSRLNRDQMLLLVTMLRDRFLSLQVILANRPPAAQSFDSPLTSAELDKSISALSEAQLEADSVLPRGFPLPFKPTAPTSEAFTARVSEQNARFELLQQVIRIGLQEIWKQIPAAPSVAQQAAIETALTAADELSARKPAPASSVVDKALTETLATLHTALGGGGAASSPKPRSSSQISAEIRTLSKIAWLVFALVTTALGTYVLVLSNLGFGTCTDFLVCLFWGFGLPVGGAQLAQATTATASTALGFAPAKP